MDGGPCPNKPGQTACFCCSAAVNLCIVFFFFFSLSASSSFKERGTRERQVRDDDTSIISRYGDCVYTGGPGKRGELGNEFDFEGVCLKLQTSESGLRSSFYFIF